MKRLDIEKRLKSELNKNSPSDFESVWNKCDEFDGGRYESNASAVAVKTIDYKRVASVLLAGLLAVSLIIVALWQVFAKAASPRFGSGYFVIDVNPSVEIAHDEKGTILSAEGLNDDGKALLVGMNLVGESFETATEKIISRCLSLGYFSSSRDDNAVLASAYDEDGEKNDAAYSALKAKLVNAFSQKKVKGVVIGGVADPKLQAEGEKYGVDGQKYGLILEYLALGGELDEAKYSSVSIRELYAAIEDKKLELKNVRAIEAESVLVEFEKRLRETLAEQVSVIVNTLGVYLSEGNLTQEKLASLQSAVDRLEQSGENVSRKKVVTEILTMLDELSALQSDVFITALIEGAKTSISVTYDFFETALRQLVKLKATPETISEIRLSKFASYGESEVYFDETEWQNSHEDYFSERWFELKEKWRADRDEEI